VIDDMQMAAESGYQWSAAALASGKPFITAEGTSTLRSGPGTHFVASACSQRHHSKSSGRNPDNTWLHIARLTRKEKGWVSAQTPESRAILTKLRSSAMS
jgi:hypothetical protein